LLIRLKPDSTTGHAVIPSSRVNDKPLNHTEQPPLWDLVMEQTLGARLRSQRESQRVALATIAEETKI